MVVDNLKLRTHVLPAGGDRVKDLNCYSMFAISVIDEIGTSICKVYSFLPKVLQIYLFMYNIGGIVRKKNILN